MDVFNKKSQKERQLNYYYSKKGQDTYKNYYIKNKEKIASYAKEYREKKKIESSNEKSQKDLRKKPKYFLDIKRGSFIVHFD